MMARSGNMQTAPIRPVKVVGRRRRGAGPTVFRSWPAILSVTEVTVTVWRIMEGSGTRRKRDIVTYAHPRTQGTDCPAARAAWSLSVLQRGGGHDLRRQGARAARQGPELPGCVRGGSEDRRAAGRGRSP